MPPVQSTDLTVSRKKFNREIAEFRSLGEQYRQRGWFLTHAKYPHAMVILATPKVKPSMILTGVSFDYTNYDAMPPSVRLVNPFTGEAFKNSELPTQLMRALPEQHIAEQIMVQPQQPYMQAYGPNDIPFLCVAGVREYHEHPGHSGDLWDMHRPSGAGRLVRIIEIISKYGLETITGIGIQMIPKISFNFGSPPR